MVYILDFSSFQETKKIYSLYNASGTKENTIFTLNDVDEFMKILKEIRVKIGVEEMIYINIFNRNSQIIIDTAKNLKNSIKGCTYIKTNKTIQGFKAKNILAKDNINVFTYLLTSNKGFFKEDNKDYLLVKPLNINNYESFFKPLIKRLKSKYLLSNHSKNIVSNWEKIYNHKN